MKPNFSKHEKGLIPVIIQNNATLQVLMLGYMNEKAFEKTKQEGRVTFYSRSKQRLWTKGEISGNYLIVEEILLDCDADTLLVKATPMGATCHTGHTSCFKEQTAKGFTYQLQRIIDDKIKNNDVNSYTNNLYRQGINKIAQKIGEEAVETIIEAKDNNRESFINETADLIYHLLVLLRYKKVTFEQIEECLKNRN